MHVLDDPELWLQLGYGPELRISEEPEAIWRAATEEAQQRQANDGRIVTGRQGLGAKALGAAVGALYERVRSAALPAAGTPMALDAGEVAAACQYLEFVLRELAEAPGELAPSIREVYPRFRRAAQNGMALLLDGPEVSAFAGAMLEAAAVIQRPT